ncbi:MntP/YtaF family protein [Cuneatibacter caecimuris]|uniref:Putative Mn2+ efflux pump MntP n=1 Tax=Cuneatibacter caecimuris TaxID=1796618 RepID=A0A4Q7PMY9_9FIRM|nr:hypothetical protein [Cuneatibacter caecimuris]RZT02309.1 putative Mn2+ efflux pump MntP [Cuneatibacter caecimuris]
MQPHLLASLIFALSSNADSLVAGMAYGIKKIRILWLSNLLVGLICFSGTLVSMIFGRSILLAVPEGFAGFLGGAIIIFIGAFGLIRLLIHRNGDEVEEESLPSLRIRETLLLGAALAVNNVGLGIGASMSGLPVISTAFCSLFASLVLLYLGNLLGRSRLASLVGKYAEPLADILMIGLGLFEILF